MSIMLSVSFCLIIVLSLLVNLWCLTLFSLLILDGMFGKLLEEKTKLKQRSRFKLIMGGKIL